MVTKISQLIKNNDKENSDNSNNDNMTAKLTEIVDGRSDDTHDDGVAAFENWCCATTKQEPRWWYEKTKQAFMSN